MPVEEWSWHSWAPYILEEQEAESQQEGELGHITSRPASSDELPPLRLCLWKGSKPSRTALSTKDQMFKYINLYSNNNSLLPNV